MTPAQLSELMRRRGVHLLLIVASCFLVYANSLHGGMVFDDQSSIIDKKLVHDLANFLQNGSGYAANSRRYLGNLSFALNYRLGGLDTFGYHLVNVAIHTGNAVLLYFLARATFRTPQMRERGGESDSATAPGNLVPLLAALLFALHPIETQAVSYIVQRLTSLMSFFYLGALLAYARLRLAADREGSGAQIGALYLVGLLCAVCAMHTKENAFTLPFALVLYEFAFFSGPPLKRLLGLLPFLATLLIIPLGLLNLHQPVGRVISDVHQATQVQTELSRWDYLLTQFRVIVTYLRLLIFPVGQNLDYDYPVYGSLSLPPVFASLLLLLTLAGASLLLWLRSRNGRGELRLISWGILFFFLALSVESSIIPIIDVIFEHRLYLPSAGAFLAAAAGFSLLLQRLSDGGRKGALAAAAVVLIALGSATVLRNQTWSDGVTLWRDVVEKSPGKVRGYNNLGAALSDDNPEEAIAIFKRALLVKPDHPEAYYNLGRIYLQRPGMLNESLSLLSRALELKPNYDDALVNLGAGYIKAGNPGLAIKELESVSSDGKGRPDRLFNLGVAYVLVGDRGRAEEEALALQERDPALAQRLGQYMEQRFASAH
jgi:protein O-mannosyl-transferase